MTKQQRTVCESLLDWRNMEAVVPYLLEDSDIVEVKARDPFCACKIITKEGEAVAAYQISKKTLFIREDLLSRGFPGALGGFIKTQLTVSGLEVKEVGKYNKNSYVEQLIKDNVKRTS